MPNYVQKVRRELKARISDYDQWGERRDALLDLYALLVLVKGEATSMEDIHDAWSLWTNAANPGHESLVPFWHLPERIAEYDRPYMEAVREVAALLERARSLAAGDGREDAYFGVNRSQREYEQATWERFDSLAGG